jgi:subtilisin family serine protease
MDLRNILITCSILLTLFLPALASNERYVKGEILVQLEPEVSANQFITEIRKTTGHDVFVVRQVSVCWNIWLLKVQEGEEKIWLNELNRHKYVIAAQLNHYLSKRNNIPNDQRYNEQWNMNNTGQSGGKPGADIKAERAWNFTTGGVTTRGDSIVIAVIDDGVDLNHADLRFWKNRAEIPSNGIDDDGNGYIDDYHGWNVATQTGTITPDDHGTHVAGIAGATGNNLIGVAGVNWNVLIMPVQIRDYTDAEVAAAYSYVFEQRKIYDATNGLRGAFVVVTNSSFGEDYANPDDYPLWCGMYDSLGSIGILSAAATVNSYKDIDVLNDMPTSCTSPYLITVTNTTRFDMLANAGYGKNTVDLGAPGTAVISCKNYNTYGPMTGTSMAVPHVAGAVALIFAAACDSFIQYYADNPAVAALQIKNAILNGVDIIPALAGKTVSNGRLNLFRSILLMKHRFCAACTLNLQTTATHITCKDSADGKIEVEVLNGTPPYLYDWSNGSTTRNINSLAPGPYFIYVLDSVGCSGVATETITEPSALVVNVNVTHATLGANDGSATAGVTGGTPPYHVQWSDPDSTEGYSVNGLSWGQYSVTVTDSKGCRVIQTFYIYNTASVEERHISGVNVYPNPATDYLYIRTNEKSNISINVVLSDITGNILLREKINFMHTHLIHVQQLPAGMYLLRLFAEDFYVVRSFLIK